MRRGAGSLRCRLPHRLPDCCRRPLTSYHRAIILPSLKSGTGGEEIGVTARERFRSAQLEAPSLVAEAFGATVKSLVGVLVSLNAEVAAMEEKLASSFDAHPDAKL
jgi:hypothetical protein